MNKLEFKNLGKLPYDVEEALNRLRVNLGFCGDNYKKIIITSSLPNEGKSFVSANLWRLLAEAGKKVVLVDADIRKSVLRSRYSISSSENVVLGLSYYLAGQAAFNEVIYETNLPNAYIVPTFHSVSNPAILLQGSRFSEMLDALAAEFDYVLVDTPPLSNVSDGDLIASKCDGAILVVRGGSTPRKLVDASIKQIERSGCELMGTVLSRVEVAKNPYYRKYSKYGYYSSYYGSSRH